MREFPISTMRSLLALALAPAMLGAQPAAGRPFVIYLHGRIVEDQGPAAVSPTFGAYQYQTIVDSLGSGGAVVLSSIRATGTDPDQYAGVVARQIDSLIATGVAPEKITVVGFSKGGGIAIRTSIRLARPDVGYVLSAPARPAQRGSAAGSRVGSFRSMSAPTP